MHPEEIKFYISIALAVGMLTVIVFTFIISSVINQRKIIKLNEQLLKAEIEILEKERKRIAEDLHDELGPILSSVKLYLNALEPVVNDDKKILDKATNILDSAIEEVRQISHNLMPVALQDRGLNDAIHQLVNNIIDTRSKHVDLNSDISGLKLDKTTEVTIFRIIQELLNNILKHSKASQIKLTLYAQGNILKIMVQDNGVGFNREIVTGVNALGPGLGLKNITSRVNLLSGKLNIDSKLGIGTITKLDIPIIKILN